MLVKVANIVNTGILSDVSYDEKKEAKPDKNAIYINDAEELVYDNGSWNPSDVCVDENYKTENSHSVLREISYLTDPLFARMFFLFDYTADMSDITKLKFDLFIDLPQFIQREGNTLEIGLSSDRNFTNGGYKWEIDTSSLKERWNSFEFDISSAKKEGNVSLAEIKTIFLNFTSLNLNAEAYESFIIGLDNLRYVSNSGNTTLKINGSDIDLDFDDNDDLVDDNLDYENDSNNQEDLNEVTTETITSEPNTIHLKETVNKIVINYTLAIIILCAEFVALTAASIIAFIIIKKKK